MDPSYRVDPTQHFGLANSVAKFYRSPNVPWEDIQQAGYVGLCLAAQRYVPEKGAFSTYATPWIRCYCQLESKRHFRLTQWSTNLVRNQLFCLLRHLRLQGNLSEKGVDFFESICDFVYPKFGGFNGVSKHFVGSALVNYVSNPEVPIGEDGSFFDLEDGFGDTLYLQQEEPSADLEYLTTLLHEAREDLDARERVLFDMAIADERCTLQEMGNRWGVSRERARQIQARMYSKVKRYILSVVNREEI